MPPGAASSATGTATWAISGTPAAGTAGSRAITITNQAGATSRTFNLTARK